MIPHEMFSKIKHSSFKQRRILLTFIPSKISSIFLKVSPQNPSLCRELFRTLSAIHTLECLPFFLHKAGLSSHLSRPFSKLHLVSIAKSNIPMFFIHFIVPLHPLDGSEE